MRIQSVFQVLLALGVSVDVVCPGKGKGDKVLTYARFLGRPDEHREARERL